MSGVVCSLNSCPVSKANSVTLPVSRLRVIRLTTAPS